MRATSRTTATVSRPRAGASRDPGPGLTEHLVTLRDGRTLRAVRGGTEGPLVLLECGMGAPAATWVGVQRHLSETCRTIAYDRAGLGGSTPDDHPRDLGRMVDDLVELLDGLGVDEPFVAAGHSWGGPILRLLTQREPQRVRGLVFVDITVAAVGAQLKVVAPAFAFMHLFVRAGGRRLLVSKYDRTSWGEIDGPDIDRALADYLTEPNLRTTRQEARQIGGVLGLLAELERTGPGVPHVYLLASEGKPALRALVLETAERLAAAHPDARGVHLAEGASHFVPQERPTLTAQEVLDLLASLEA